VSASEESDVTSSTSRPALEYTLDARIRKTDGVEVITQPSSGLGILSDSKSCVTARLNREACIAWKAFDEPTLKEAIAKYASQTGATESDALESVVHLLNRMTKRGWITID
jgi:coenzyme PQQ synthesis protein D (PqqD)